MPDYGQPIRFGYFLIPYAGEPLLEKARELDRLGYDYIGIQDHPYQPKYVETWTLLSMIAAQTERVRLFTDVVNLALREPAVLGKAAATLDLLSGGRFELGLGAGAYWDPIHAYGGPRRTPAEAYTSLVEGIEVIRRIWSGESNLRFDGEIYHLAGAKSGPVPPHPMGIWLGAYGPRALRLTGRVADGWVPSLRGDSGSLAEMAAQVDAGATEAGREPGQIRRVLNINGQITDGKSEGLLRGPVNQWVEQLTDLAVGLGFDTFVLWHDAESPSGAGGSGHERFIDEIAPAVRELVERERVPG
jgi:alkanesulfonate monooxygenase SsuD/methylene tetrahydromethanopterin reductase-like flavin-dependent oxidoreductase (luciferase family)